MNITLEDLGEKEILNRLKKFMDYKQISDDTAIINNSNQDLLINTDVLVEDVHFSSKTLSADDVGWKAITSNISDLIASGAEEILSFTVGLIVPTSTEWNWVEGVYEGMEKALNKFGGKLIGGDCSRGKQKILSITAIGRLGPLRLHRGHGLPGDCLVTSGSHGLSRLGLALLLEEPRENLRIISSSLREKAIKAHQRPDPALYGLKKLNRCKPKDLPWRAAGTDSSDGLLEAIQSLCISSGCTGIIFPEELPKDHEWPHGGQWDNWCLNGGEDYELVISLPENWADEWIKSMPNAKRIGRLEKGLPKVIWENGNEINQLTFKHF
tara:strand:+ start:174 stop:1148 length:975 start_codon:yes stop_codon:yes gene_type:complete